GATASRGTRAEERDRTPATQTATGRTQKPCPAERIETSRLLDPPGLKEILQEQENTAQKQVQLDRAKQELEKIKELHLSTQDLESRMVAMNSELAERMNECNALYIRIRKEQEEKRVFQKKLEDCLSASYSKKSMKKKA